MSKSRTKEETFLLRLYELASDAGDPKTPIDRHEVTKGTGIHVNSVKNVCNVLCQTNFIRKGEEETVYLTENGIRLVMSLL